MRRIITHDFNVDNEKSKIIENALSKEYCKLTNKINYFLSSITRKLIQG